MYSIQTTLSTHTYTMRILIRNGALNKNWRSDLTCWLIAVPYKAMAEWHRQWRISKCQRCRLHQVVRSTVTFVSSWRRYIARVRCWPGSSKTPVLRTISLIYRLVGLLKIAFPMFLSNAGSIQNNKKVELIDPVKAVLIIQVTGPVETARYASEQANSM